MVPGRAGQDAEVIACDALIVPVVTGSPDWNVIGQIITLVTDAHGHHRPAPHPARRPAHAKSVPLDVGYSDHIPDAIRRAVTRRDQHCARPPAATAPPPPPTSTTSPTKRRRRHQRQRLHPAVPVSS